MILDVKSSFISVKQKQHKSIFHWTLCVRAGAGNAIIFALGALQIFFSPTKLSSLKNFVS